MKLVSLSYLSLSCCLSVSLFEIIGNKLSREGHDMDDRVSSFYAVGESFMSVCLSVSLKYLQYTQPCLEGHDMGR